MYVKGQWTIKCKPEHVIDRVTGYGALMREALPTHLGRPKLVDFSDELIGALVELFADVTPEQLPVLAAAMKHAAIASQTSRLKLKAGGRHYWDGVENRFVTPVTALKTMRDIWKWFNKKHRHTQLKQPDFEELEKKMDVKRSPLTTVINSIGLGVPEQASSNPTNEQSNASSITMGSNATATADDQGPHGELQRYRSSTLRFYPSSFQSPPPTRYDDDEETLQPIPEQPAELEDDGRANASVLVGATDPGPQAVNPKAETVRNFIPSQGNGSNQLINQNEKNFMAAARTYKNLHEKRFVSSAPKRSHQNYDT